MVDRTTRPSHGRRPSSAAAAALLTGAVAATWAFLGVAWAGLWYRTEGDALLRIPLGFVGTALCALVALMGAVGAVHAWRGRSALLRVPANFTVGLFVIAIVNLLVQGRIRWSPTQVVPLTVGAVAAAVLVLSHRPAARAWLEQAVRATTPTSGSAASVAQPSEGHR